MNIREETFEKTGGFYVLDYHDENIRGVYTSLELLSNHVLKLYRNATIYISPDCYVNRLWHLRLVKTGDVPKGEKRMLFGDIYWAQMNTLML